MYYNTHTLVGVIVMIFALYTPVTETNEENAKLKLEFNKIVSKDSLERAMSIFLAYLSDPNCKVMAKETNMEETLPYIENNYLSDYDKKMCTPVAVIYADGYYHLVLKVNQELS